jgi:hypothetical protein
MFATGPARFLLALRPRAIKQMYKARCLLANEKINEQPENKIRTLDYLHFKFCSFRIRRTAKQFCLTTEAGDKLQSSR